MIGGLIMTHGDDDGLVLPPRVAPYQVVIVPIPPRKGDWNEQVLPKAREVAAAAARAPACACTSTTATTSSPASSTPTGRCAACPLRLEIGPKDIEKDQCVLVRRDTPREGVRAARRPGRRRRAICSTRSRRTCWSGPGASWPDNTTRVATYDEFKEVMADKRGFIVAGWNGDPAVRGAHQGRDEGHRSGSSRWTEDARGALHRDRPARPRGLLRPGLLNAGRRRSR